MSAQVTRGTSKPQGNPNASSEGTTRIAFYEFSRFVVRLLLFFFVRLRVEGLEHIPAQGPAILAVNHIVWVDIPIVSVKVPRITHYMAKIEFFDAPILGKIVRWWGSFPVRRGEGDREALRTAENVVKEGMLLVIFPEGHRSGGHLIEGKGGTAMIALRTHVPIIPVAIFGSERVFHAFRPLVTVRYGKPFSLQPETGRHTRDDVVNGTREIMVRIARMMPPAYRGMYADDAAAAEAAEAAGMPSASNTPSTLGASSATVTIPPEE